MKAPIITNTRVKVVWDEENVPMYQDLIGDNLSRLRDTWCDSDSSSAVSVLLQCTNDVLTTAAAASNKVIKLGEKFRPKAVENSEVTTAQTRVQQLSSLVKQLGSLNLEIHPQLEDAKRALTAARAACKRAVNASVEKACDMRDT